MKKKYIKFIVIIIIFIIICLGLIFSISFKANNQDELQIVYKKVEKYFKSNYNSELRRNCVAFYLDKKNNVIIVVLVDNSEKQQINFKNKINVDINSKYIIFEQGNPAHLYYD